MRKTRFFKGGNFFTIINPPGFDESKEIRLDEYASIIHQTEQAMTLMKMREPDNEVSFHHDEDRKFHLSSQFGRNEITIYGDPVEIPGEEKEEPKKKYIIAQKPCLLVEMYRTGEHPGDPRPEGRWMPGAFAIFVPSGEGMGEHSAAPYANLSFAGVTTSIIENEMGVHDPPGLIGQPTYRLGWCKSGPPTIAREPLPGMGAGVSIEQLKRVDGGWTAYEGDEVEEEVTEIYTANNNWSWENIEWIYWRSDPIPGPPPEAVCGYTWSERYNDNYDSSADYSDDRHLFYGIVVGSGLAWWWPEEFNQFREIKEQWYENAMLYRAKDSYADQWDYADQIGFDVAFSGMLFPNGFSRVQMNTYKTYRDWGLLWGSYYFSDTDISGVGDYPYLGYTPVEQAEDTVSEGGVHRWYDEDGVYVKDRWSEFFLNGVSLYYGRWRFLEGWMQIEERDEQGEDRFAYPIDEPSTHALTERQKKIIEGNSDAYGWNAGTFPNRQYEEGLSGRDLCWYAINVGGKEFWLKRQWRCGTWTYGNITYYHDSAVGFQDYGIFAMPDTGIDKDGNVDAETIEPIYTYCYVTGGHPITDGGTGRYGMVIDGLNYLTEEYAFAGGSSTQRYVVPDTANVKDSDGVKLECWGLARAGVITIVTEQ